MMKLSTSFKNIIFFLPLTILIVERIIIPLRIILIPYNKDFDSLIYGVPNDTNENSATQNPKGQHHKNENMMENGESYIFLRWKSQNLQNDLKNDFDSLFHRVPNQINENSATQNHKGQDHKNENMTENGESSVFLRSGSHNLQNDLKNDIVRPVPLDRLTKMGEEFQCQNGKKKLDFDRHLQDYGDLKIPRIVHQTSKSRCFTKRMWKVMRSWHLGDDWAYYFHSDEAVDLLFQMPWPEFPHLSTMIPCLNGKGTLKADLWRYLVLWEYGGIYADIDTKPNLFNATTITSEDDGFFVVEQYHMLSQYFMAVSPRHPIMFYTIHQVLSTLANQEDVGMIYAPAVTGPRLLHSGFQYFMKDKGVKVTDWGKGLKPAKAGLWVGTNNRSITVAGVGENENEYVFREYIRRNHKIEQYHELGMEHFSKEMNRTDKTCMRVLWDAHLDSLKKLEEARIQQ